jgi:hypothetical protein
MWGIGLGRWVDLEIKKKGRGFGEFDLRAAAERAYADLPQTKYILTTTTIIIYHLVINTLTTYVLPHRRDGLRVRTNRRRCKL